MRILYDLGLTQIGDILRLRSKSMASLYSGHADEVDDAGETQVNSAADISPGDSSVLSEEDA